MILYTLRIQCQKRSYTLTVTRSPCFSRSLFTRADLLSAQSCAIRMYVSRSGKPGIIEVSDQDQEDSLSLLVSILLGFRRNGTRLLASSVPPEYKNMQNLLNWHKRNPADASRKSNDDFPPPFDGYTTMPRNFLYRLRQNVEHGGDDLFPERLSRRALALTFIFKLGGTENTSVFAVNVPLPL